MRCRVALDGVRTCPNKHKSAPHRTITSAVPNARHRVKWGLCMMLAATFVIKYFGAAVA